MKETQLPLFGDGPSKRAESTLGEDPDKKNSFSRSRKKSDLSGQRYLVVPLATERGGYEMKTDLCSACGRAMVATMVDGKLLWLDSSSIRPAGRNARTAIRHRDVCPKGYESRKSTGS